MITVIKTDRTTRSGHISIWAGAYLSSPRTKNWKYIVTVEVDSNKYICVLLDGPYETCPIYRYISPGDIIIFKDGEYFY